MANIDTPMGFRPVRHLDGSPYNGATNPYFIANAYNTAIFTNDPVKMLATGLIALAGAGDTILGFFQGCSYLDSEGKPVFKPYWPASTSTFNSVGATANIADAPDLILEGQMDSDAVVPSQLDVGTNADLINTHTGSTATGLSKAEIDTSTCTTATAQFRVLRFVPKPDNEIGNFAKVEVLVNEHFYKTTTGI